MVFISPNSLCLTQTNWGRIRSGQGPPGEDRQYRLAVRIKKPAGNWLKSMG